MGGRKGAGRGEGGGGALPRPFYDDGWKGEEREAAHALWHWHLGLLDAVRGGEGVDGVDHTAERARAERGEPLRLLPQSTSQAAYDACRTHGLPLEDLAAQVEGAARLRGEVRFPTRADLRAWHDLWTLPHGRLLARLAGAARSWQVPLVEETARGLWLTGRIVGLADDLARGWLFFPLEELAQMGADEARLRAGEVEEGERKLLWKQVVRARDALARGQKLADELPRGRRRAYKRCWFGALELLAEVERRDYDVFAKPVALGPWRRAQVGYLSLFGKTAFRRR